MKSNAQKRHSGSLKVHAAGLGVIAVSAGCLWVLGLAPVAANQQAGNTQRLQISAAGDRLAALKGARDERVAQLDQLGEELAASEVELQPLRARNRVLADLTELASEYGLEIDLDPLEAPVERELYLAQPIELHGRGGYRACAMFLSAVVQRFSDVQVSSFALTSGARSGGEDQFRFDLAWYADRDGNASKPSEQSG